MPLTSKGTEIKANMEKEYGSKKGEEVFYASRNKGTIAGVDKADAKQPEPQRQAGSSTVDRAETLKRKIALLRSSGSNKAAEALEERLKELERGDEAVYHTGEGKWLPPTWHGRLDGLAAYCDRLVGRIDALEVEKAKKSVEGITSLCKEMEELLARIKSGGGSKKDAERLDALEAMHRGKDGGPRSQVGEARGDGYEVHSKKGGVELLENNAYDPSKWFTRGPGGIQEYSDKAQAVNAFRGLAKEYGS